MVFEAIKGLVIFNPAIGGGRELRVFLNLRDLLEGGLKIMNFF